MTAVERDGVRGMLAWTDLFYLEVVDPSSGEPVAEGQPGALVMTPLWSNTITPFLRWYTGDIVTLRRQPRTDDPFSVFPVLEHTLRTEGFFKVRGININHADLEEFMFAQEAVADFRAEADQLDSIDVLRLLVELHREADRAVELDALREAFKARFELTAQLELLETGALARDFEKAVKVPRFVDKRRGG